MGIEKATAMVVRRAADGLELLLFRHPGMRQGQEATIQFPAGTVEAGEGPEAAAVRELREETGLEAVEVVSTLAVLDEPPGKREAVLLTPTPVGERMLTRGMPVHVLEEVDSRAHIRYGEDRVWVSAGDLTRERTRYLVLLRLTGPVQEAWTSRCDCGAALECRWAPIDGNEGIAPTQAVWLEAVRDKLVKGGAGV
jgi:8-oxo-dGTP pyrophosphatase MutT (NUDIX family)